MTSGTSMCSRYSMTQTAESLKIQHDTDCRKSSLSWGDPALRPNFGDRKPGIVLAALKTTEGTTRSPAYVWYPEDDLIRHASHGAHIPHLGGNFDPQGGSSTVLSFHELTTMWKVINTTELTGITSDNLASSMDQRMQQWM